MKKTQNFRVAQYRFNSFLNKDAIWTFFCSEDGVDYEFEIDFDMYCQPQLACVTVVGANKFALSDQRVDEIFMDFCDLYESGGL